MPGLGRLLWMIVASGVAGDAIAADSARTSIGIRLQEFNWFTTEIRGQGSDGEKVTFGEGNVLGATWQWQQARFYLGGSAATGEINFTGTGFARPDGATATNRKGDTAIARTELDLVTGYYVWRSVSLFADLKTITNKWADDYKTNIMGLGVGANYTYSFSESWSLFGSAGLLPLKTSDNDGAQGDGLAGGAEINVQFAPNSRNAFALGLKNQWFEYEYSSGLKQRQAVSSGQFRYAYLF